MATTPVQTSYPDALAPAFAGMKATYTGVPDVKTGINNDAASIPAGWGVARDSSLADPRYGAKLPAATSDKFFGISMHTHVMSLGPLADIDAVGYKPGVAFPILREGRVWAVAELGCAVGDRGYVRCTAAGQGKGSLLNSDPGSNTVLATNGKILEWQTAASALALAVVEVQAFNA